MKYIREVKETFSSTKFPVFKMRDLRTLLSRRGIGEGYSRLLVHKLAEEGAITRITKGIYSFHEDVDVVGFAFRPFYYGVENALSLLGISDQGTNPIVITTRNVRKGSRQFRGRNYVVRTIRKDLFFGYSLLKVGDFWLPVSDIEKSLIDIVYFDGAVREDLAEKIRGRIDRRRLDTYLKRYDRSFSNRVLGSMTKR